MTLSRLETDERQTLAKASEASVVLYVYTSTRWVQIERALASLRQQRHQPVQVVVVVDDNPALERRLRAEVPDVLVVKSHHPRGLAGARNSGIETSSGDVVVFLDDAYADSLWLEELPEPYRHPEVMGVGGVARPDWDGGEQPTWMPPEFLWIVGCNYQRLPALCAPIRNPIGANMSFRRRAFAPVGPFRLGIGRDRTSRPLGCEETEFGIRLLQLVPDARVLYQPTAVVYHEVPPERLSWRYFQSRCLAEAVSQGAGRPRRGRSGRTECRALQHHTHARAEARGMHDPSQ